uniref:Uncharacterized protein n=1 Tax=Panagrellus redivivus TaxID=6233 RepID=A0A7E4W6S4_PANRE
MQSLELRQQIMKFVRRPHLTWHHVDLKWVPQYVYTTDITTRRNCTGDACDGLFLLILWMHALLDFWKRGYTNLITAMTVSTPPC